MVGRTAIFRRSSSLEVLFGVALIACAVTGVVARGLGEAQSSAIAATSAVLLLAMLLVWRVVLRPTQALAAHAVRLTDRYREVVERAGDGIFTADQSGILLDVNPRGCTMLQRPLEEVLGRPISAFVHPDEVPALAQMIARLITGESDVREWRMRLPGDVCVPVEVNATALPNGRLQGIAREITDRKRAEQELRRVLRQQQSVAELGEHALGPIDVQGLMNEAVALVADGLAASYCKVLELVPDGTTLRLRAAVGWPPELIGHALVPTGRESQAGFTLLTDAAVVVEDLRTETRFRGPVLVPDHEVVSGLSVVVRSNARPFGVLAVHATERLHFTADDVHFVESVANILAHAIARADADHALRASELRYRLAARATRDAMYDWDIANDRTFWSEGMTLLFGHAPGAVGRGLEWWKDYIHPEDREGMLRHVAETLSAGTRAWRADYRFRRADGSYATVQDRGYVEYGPDGTPLRAVGAMTDVTEQKQAEEALRRQVAFVKLAGDVAVTANEADGVSEAFTTIVRLVCRHTGWPVGHALVLQRIARDAPPPNLWHLEDPVRFAELRRISDATVFERGVGTIGRVWNTGQPAWVAESRWSSPRRAEALASGLRGGFAFPVLVGSTVVGVVEFFSEDEVPPADDFVAVMGGIGTQLGRVVERAQAEAHLRDSAERLEGLSRRLMQTQETERRHVARELHDEIGQTLTVLKLNLGALDTDIDADHRRALLEESTALTDRTLQQVRDLSLDLRPALLDDLGLVPALRWYLDRQARRAGFTAEFTAIEVGDAIPAEVATACFRIAQEALTNVARHAQTTHVVMQLAERQQWLELVVRDAGQGFDREQTLARAEQGGSLGLVGMRERAALAGGDLTIDSAPGRGTAIRVVLPLAGGTAEMLDAERRSA